MKPAEAGGAMSGSLTLIAPARPMLSNLPVALFGSVMGISEQFEILAVQVERMEARQLLGDEQLEFAHAAMTVRYPTWQKPAWSPRNFCAAVGLRTSLTISGAR